MQDNPKIEVDRGLLETAAGQVQLVLAQLMTQKQWRGLHCEAAIISQSCALAALGTALGDNTTTISGDSSPTAGKNPIAENSTKEASSPDESTHQTLSGDDSPPTAKDLQATADITLHTESWNQDLPTRKGQQGKRGK